jgi:ribulose-phosphate 3-epimerase
MKKHVKISASLMCDSFRHLEKSLHEMEEAGIDLIHVDVMDGTFVPNFTLGPDIIRAVKEMTSIPIDVHLMSLTPERHLDSFLSCGIEYFSIHAETCYPLTRSIQYIHDAGVKAGIALSPATSATTLDQILTITDFVMLMTVEPGYSGQKLVPFALDKIAVVKEMVVRQNPHCEIMADGNVSFEIAPQMVLAGADILVAGTSSVFKSGMTITEGTDKLRKAICSNRG